MASENKNLALYEALRAVPEHAQKPFNNGNFKGTDINPMWRIQKLTETFGPCGFGWYTEIVSRQLEHSIDGKTVCSFIGLNLYVNINGEWSKPIYGEGGNTMCDWVASKGYIKTSDEAFKMAYTDALGNAAKQLGLGADVWWELDKVHSTKYDKQTELLKENDGKPTSQVQVKPEAKKPAATPTQPIVSSPIEALLEGCSAKMREALEAMNAANTKDELKAVYNNYKELLADDELKEFKQVVTNKGLSLAV